MVSFLCLSCVTGVDSEGHSSAGQPAEQPQSSGPGDGGRCSEERGLQKPGQQRGSAALRRNHTDCAAARQSQL